MIPQREDEHVETGLALLTEQFKDAATVRAILTALLNRVQELEDETWDLLWGWVLGYAEGQQLDDLGAIVGQLREGRNDDDYRDAIVIRTRVNRSKGRASDMTDVLALLDPASTYLEYFPYAWEASLYDVPNGGDIIRLISQAKAAGSYGVLLTSTWVESGVFKFGGPFPSSTGGAADTTFACALPSNPTYLLFA
jgi:hypothetical protein